MNSPLLTREELRKHEQTEWVVSDEILESIVDEDLIICKMQLKKLREWLKEVECQ